MGFYEDLDSVKAGMRLNNIGSADTKLAYEKVTGRAGDVSLLGPYQIRQDEWEGLAAEAGIPGAPWYDRNAQEVVVGHKLAELFNQYGQWDLASTAWRAGTEIADRISLGESISEVVAGDGADELQQYLNNVMVASDEASPMPAPDIAAQSRFANSAMVDQRPAPVRKKRSPDDVIAGALTAMRDAKLAGGGEEDDGLDMDQRSGADA